MSRWSSPYRALIAAAALGLACLGAASADDTAVLRDGPEPAREIPYFPPNALAAHRGDYLIGPRDFQIGPAEAPEGEDEPRAAEVWYTREALVFPSDWAASRCGGLRVLVVAGQEDYTLCYPDERGFTLFFEFPGREPAPAGGPPAEACAFLETFVWRFQILLGLIGAGREPPFPAILQVPG